MLHALTHSIKQHLDVEITELTEVVWMYDGVSLSGRNKPFATIEQLQEESEAIAAGREDYAETYHFQIGLRARTNSERSSLSDKIKEALRTPDITFYNTSAYPPTEAGVFVCDILAVTPMPSDDVTNETDKHRVYFDVEVSVQVVNGGLTFEQ